MAESWRAKPVRIGAIDVGSNGIRLAIGEVDTNGAVSHINSFREAVRLGTDAFAPGGVLGEKIISDTVAAFEKFKKLMDEHEVARHRAVATSATRESSNGDELVACIAEKTSINLETIGPLEEAQLVFLGVAGVVDVTHKTALMIDMGGGSIEVTVTRDRLALGCESLRIGPVRLMQKLVDQGLTEADGPQIIERYRGAVKELIRAELEDNPPDLCVGTGGNIVRMGKLRTQLLGKTKAYKVKPGDLDSMIDKLLAMPVEDRIKKLSLRPDRADVIALATMALRLMIADLPITRVLIPGVGLKEGLLRYVAHHPHG